MWKTNQQLQTLLEDDTDALAGAESQRARKVAALGLLVAGIAQEIANPVTFIFSGLPSLERDIDRLTALIPADQRDDRFAEVSRRVTGLLEAIGDGAKRTAETIQELRSLSDHDENELRNADLHALLDAALPNRPAVADDE